MNLLNEMISDWELTELAKQMDAVLNEYEHLIAFTQLNEGVLDSLSDELVQKVSELQSRIEAVARARAIVSKLQKSGGFNKKEAAKHRKAITNNSKALTAALKRTMKNMDQIKKTAKAEIKKAIKGKIKDKQPDTEVAPEVDITVYGRLAPFILNMANQGKLTTDIMQGDKYSDTFDSLKKDDFVTADGTITPDGREALEAHRANRGKAAPRQSPSAIDDLAAIGGDDSDDDTGLADISFG